MYTSTKLTDGYNIYYESNDGIKFVKFLSIKDSWNDSKIEQLLVVLNEENPEKTGPSYEDGYKDGYKAAERDLDP